MIWDCGSTELPRLVFDPIVAGDDGSSTSLCGHAWGQQYAIGVETSDLLPSRQFRAATIFEIDVYFGDEMRSMI